MGPRRYCMYPVCVMEKSNVWHFDREKPSSKLKLKCNCCPRSSFFFFLYLLSHFKCINLPAICLFHITLLCRSILMISFPSNDFRVRKWRDEYVTEKMSLDNWIPLEIVSCIHMRRETLRLHRKIDSSSDSAYNDVVDVIDRWVESACLFRITDSMMFSLNESKSNRPRERVFAK